MQVGNTTGPAWFKLLTAKSQPTEEASFDQKVEKSAGSKMSVDPISSVGAIAGRYDLNNISPREIDQLAHELNDSGNISTQDFMILLTRGAEFLSHMPGNRYTEERLNQKTDLIADFQYSLKMSQNGGAPTEGLEHLLATLEKIQSLGEEERDKFGRQPVSQFSDKMLSGLIDLQAARSS